MNPIGPCYPDTHPEEIVLNAHRNNDPVTIIYKDRKGTKTSRMIESLEIETDPYSGLRWVKSSCLLQQAERTFILEREPTPSRQTPCFPRSPRKAFSPVTDSTVSATIN